MADVIEQLRECCRDSQGREMKDFAEPWGCEVGLLRQAATELESLRKRCEAVEAALLRLCKSMPTDADMEAAGWEGPEIEEACNAYDAAQAIAAAQEPSHG